jgi:hypothetical protein
VTLAGGLAGLEWGLATTNKQATNFLSEQQAHRTNFRGLAVAHIRIFSAEVRKDLRRVEARLPRVSLLAKTRSKT